MPESRIQRELEEAARQAQEMARGPEPEPDQDQEQPEPAQEKRKRTWEKEKLFQDRAKGLVMVAYRGIPRELNEAMKEIAKENSLTTGELAAQWLTYAHRQYKAGQLKVKKGRRGRRRRRRG